MCFRSDQEEWLTQSVHSTIVPVGVSCHAVHYCSRKGLQLDVTVEGFLPSGLHSTSQLTECQLVESCQLSSGLVSLCFVSRTCVSSAIGFY